MKWKDLLSSFYNVDITNEGNPEISSIHMDSREVKQGGLFFCIRGYNVDGHDFIEQAINNGAVAIISELPLVFKTDVPIAIVKDIKKAMAKIATTFYDNPSKDMQVIGVTGTNGKTTITHLIESILHDTGKKTGLVGTMYTKINNEIHETNNTTPESILLQRIFKEMKEDAVETVAMEVSSHALQSGRVRGTDFDIAVFSNLTPEHLDFHKTMERYKFAKGLLFAQMGNVFQRKVAVLNTDDPASKDFEAMTIAEVLTYGIDNPADFKAENITISSKGTQFEVVVYGKHYTFNTHLIGKFSVYNILAATAAAYASGVTIEQIQESVESINGVTGRFETVKVEAPYTVIVDYAHTPDSLENVLNTVNEFAEGKVRVVVGCGGDRDKKKRPLMGEIATRLVDEAIFTSDNPRKENPAQILEDMKVGATSDNYTIIEDRKSAIEYAVDQAKENDIIVIAGKGHETYQIFSDETIDFDDKIVAENAIKNRNSDLD